MPCAEFESELSFNTSSSYFGVLTRAAAGMELTYGEAGGEGSPEGVPEPCAEEEEEEEAEEEEAEGKPEEDIVEIVSETRS